MITITHLTKTYQSGRIQVKALENIEMTIGSGMFGLVGPNGAGKTTLMRIIAGLMSPTSGSVSVFNHDMNTHQGKQAAKALLGYLPQELGLYPNLTAAEFLDYIAILKGVTDSAFRRQQIPQLLELVGLVEMGNRKLKTYSGGMKRRVGIAQALLGNPQLLIVDEPTVGLDPEERVKLRNLLSDVAQRCTVILSTHIIEDISQSCNDLAMLNKGRVMFRGAPRELIAAARGHVWLILNKDGRGTSSERPNDGLSVVSTLQLADGVQYRVIGQPSAAFNAQPTEPTLEDGYIFAMQQTKQPA